MERFIGLLDEFNADACEFADRPDLVIREMSPLVGVEHTRIFLNNEDLPSGRQKKRQEKFHQQITDRAHATFRQTSTLPLNVVVSFRDSYDYRAPDISAIGDELALTVSRAIRLVGPNALVDRDVRVEDWQLKSRGYQFPRGIESFHFKMEKNSAYELWGPAYGYAVPNLSVGDIKTVIERKEAWIGEYLSRCERVWLLIVTDTGMPSSHYSVPNQVIEYSYKTEFESLFVMTCFHGALFELKNRA